MKISKIAPHYWEEPCLSGIEEANKKGSGTVFFNGCSLQCVYCQNIEISKKDSTKGVFFTPNALSEEFLKLQQIGVHNINLVTPTHYIPSIIAAISQARRHGLLLPIVYNCGGYESVETLKLLEGYIDIYLPDIKYFSSQLSLQYSNCENYYEKCLSALFEMLRQTKKPIFNTNGIMLKGTIVRHMVLPGCDFDSKKIIENLHKEFGDDKICLSLMNQYTPITDSIYPELSETITRASYLRVVQLAQKYNFKYLFTQGEGANDKRFIPEFY